nr:apoptosis inhibitor 5-like protein API5 isoform X2 [Tanacetum cinerariifolium]
MFMDFLKSLSIFGEKAPTERVQELVEIIEGQADLDAQFSVSDGDHVDRLISCLYMALPFFVRGASSSKFLNYLNKHILPVFDKLSIDATRMCEKLINKRGFFQVVPSLEVERPLLLIGKE